MKFFHHFTSPFVLGLLHSKKFQKSLANEANTAVRACLNWTFFRILAHCGNFFTLKYVNVNNTNIYTFCNKIACYSRICCKYTRLGHDGTPHDSVAADIFARKTSISFGKWSIHREMIGDWSDWLLQKILCSGPEKKISQFKYRYIPFLV